MQSLVNPLVLQSLRRRPSVGRMCRIGHGNVLHLRQLQHLQPLLHVQLRAVRNPQHQPPNRVVVERARLSQSCGLQLLRILHVGREKQVKRSAVLYLQGKVTRGAEVAVHLVPRLTLKARSHLRKDSGQVSGGGHRDLLRAGQHCPAAKHYERQKLFHLGTLNWKDVTAGAFTMRHCRAMRQVLQP